MPKLLLARGLARGRLPSCFSQGWRRQRQEEEEEEEDGAAAEMRREEVEIARERERERERGGREVVEIEHGFAPPAAAAFGRPRSSSTPKPSPRV